MSHLIFLNAARGELSLADVCIIAGPRASHNVYIGDADIIDAHDDSIIKWRCKSRRPACHGKSTY